MTKTTPDLPGYRRATRIVSMVCTARAGPWRPSGAKRPLLRDVSDFAKRLAASSMQIVAPDTSLVSSFPSRQRSIERRLPDDSAEYSPIGTARLVSQDPKKMALRPRSKSPHISSRQELAYQDLTLRVLACVLPDN
jgi:hypothetical protein